MFIFYIYFLTKLGNNGEKCNRGNGNCWNKQTYKKYMFVSCELLLVSLVPVA